MASQPASCGELRSARIHPMKVSPDRPAGRPTIRRILLADADAFYVSVARLVDPAGAGRATLLIVGGSAERRGVVTSASYEARHSASIPRCQWPAPSVSVPRRR